MNISQLEPQVAGLHRKLSTTLKKLTSDKKLYSKKEFWNALFEALYPAKEALANIFGAQSRWEKAAAPLLGGLFSYARSDYAEGLLVAYYEPVGVAGHLEAATNEIDKRFRSEVFMKGCRWSKVNLKTDFYVYIQRVARFLDTESYPLDFWKTHPARDYLQIDPGFPCRPGAVASSVDLRMPYVDLPCGQWPRRLKACFSLWKKIQDGKEDQFADFSASAFRRAEHQFCRSSRQLLTPFHTYLTHMGWDATQLAPQTLFRLITLYHCYDNPYTIHLFRSVADRNAASSSVTVSRTFKDPKAIIALTLPTSAPALSGRRRQFFQKLCNTVGLLHDIESVLAKKRRKHIELFWRLERAYNEERPKYSRLVSTVGLILNAVCEQAGVPIQLPVEARSKEAESLFTKLCDWSNGSRKRCQRTPREWREAVESTNMSFIARHMPDIGGIRIVCVFEKDVERVRKAVDDLIKQGELVSRRSWAKKRLFSDSEEGLVIKGYRAWHCDVSLGKKRLALVECKGLQELVCEIQLKSAVSHAWAQASHRISYKTGVPRRVFKKKGGPLRQGIGRAALRLEDGDIALNQAKRAYEGLTSG